MLLNAFRLLTKRARYKCNFRGAVLFRVLNPSWMQRVSLSLSLSLSLSQAERAESTAENKVFENRKYVLHTFF